MKICSIAHKVPPTRLTNDQALALFRDASAKSGANGDWGDVERRLKFFLKMAGTRTRHTLAPDENALDLAVAAANDALEKAGIAADELDLVIYASVSRGWLEPCMAVAMQEKIGAVNATSFDVLDACASWLRALHVVHGLIRAGTYRKAIIISLEAGMADFVRFNLPDRSALKKYSAAVTLGEAATATILSADQHDDDFYFNFKTFSGSHDLCLMPLDNIGNYAPELKPDGVAANKFMADSGKLIGQTIDRLVAAYTSDSELSRGGYDICFSHAASVQSGNMTCEALGIPLSRYFSTHENYGNTGAASVPLAMSLASDAGRLERDQRVLIAVGSAGITIGFATFTF